MTDTSNPHFPDAPSSPEDLGLTVEHVRRVAHMARLEISESDTERYIGELGKVLAWASMLNHENLDSMEPMASLSDDEVSAAQPRWDSDEPGPMLSPGVLEAMAPEMDHGFISVPKVLDGGGGA